MKKQIITLLLSLFASLSLWAQKEYKITKNSGKLHLNLNGVSIEGYDGNEIIFSSQKTSDEEEDERAKGLQAINGSGYKDNTGLGINVTEKGQDVEVNLIGNNTDRDSLKIRVPKQMDIVFSYNKTQYAEPVIVKNMKGELEISTTHNKVELENNSGPMNIKTVYGGIDAAFQNDIKGPVSIISVYGYVDVALPTVTKANVELGTSYGKLYAADAFNIAVTKTASDNDDDDVNEFTFDDGTSVSAKVNAITKPVTKTVSATTISASANSISSKNGVIYLVSRSNDAENIKGTINGGGTDLIFKSTYKNVYLRTADK